MDARVEGGRETAVVAVVGLFVCCPLFVANGVVFVSVFRVHVRREFVSVASQDFVDLFVGALVAFV